MADTVILKDGTPGWAWPLLPTHRESLVKAFDELSPESRRLRFLTPVERLCCTSRAVTRASLPLSMNPKPNHLGEGLAASGKTSVTG